MSDTFIPPVGLRAVVPWAPQDPELAKQAAVDRAIAEGTATGLASNVYTAPDYVNADPLTRAWHSGAVNNAWNTVLGAIPAMANLAATGGKYLTAEPGVEGSLAPPMPRPTPGNARFTYSGQENVEKELEGATARAEQGLGIQRTNDPVAEMWREGATGLTRLLTPAAVAKVPGRVGHMLDLLLPTRTSLPAFAGIQTVTDPAIAAVQTATDPRAAQAILDYKQQHGGQLPDTGPTTDRTIVPGLLNVTQDVEEPTAPPAQPVPPQPSPASAPPAASAPPTAATPPEPPVAAPPTPVASVVPPAPQPQPVASPVQPAAAAVPTPQTAAAVPPTQQPPPPPSGQVSTPGAVPPTAAPPGVAQVIPARVSPPNVVPIAGGSAMGGALVPPSPADMGKMITKTLPGGYTVAADDMRPLEQQVAAPQPGAPAAPTGPAAPIPKDRQGRGQAIHDEFVKLGYPDHIAWGFAANALHESGGDPNTKSGDAGASHGLFQWQKDRLTNFVKLFGHTPEQGTLQEAVQFMHWELQNSEKRHAPAIMGTKTAQEAAAVISRDLIRPAKVEENMQRRGATAAQLAASGAQQTAAAPTAAQPTLFQQFPPGAPPPATGGAQAATVGGADAAKQPSLFQQYGPTAAPAVTPKTDLSEAQGETGYPMWVPAVAGASLVGALAARGHGGARLARAFERMGVRSGEAARIAEHNARVGALNTPGVPATSIGEAPLPPSGIVPGETGTRAQTYWQNRNTPLHDLNEALDDTRYGSSTFQARLDATQDSQVETQIRSQMRSGVSMFDGSRVTPAAKYFQAAEDLAKADQVELNQALKMADEVDNRRIRARDPTTYPDPKFKFQNIETRGYYDPSGNYVKGLLDYITDARAKPELDDVWRLRQQAIVRDPLDIARREGRVDAASQARMLSDRPNFIASVDDQGKAGSSFERRDISGGGTREFIGNVWDADIQSYTNAMKEIARNKPIADLVERYTAQQAADPKLSKMFTPSKDAAGNWVKPTDTSAMHVTTYHNGEARHHYVHNSLVHTAFQAPPAITGSIIGTLAKIRRSVSHYTTGAGGLVAGKVFAATTHLPRNTALIPVLRQRGFAAGYADEWAQRLGFKPGIKGDPTFALKVATEIPKQFGGWGAGLLAEAFSKRTNSVASRGLRAWLGDPKADHVVSRLQAMHDASNYARLQREGVTNVGAWGGVPPAETTALAKGSQIRAPGMDLAPTLFRNPNTLPQRILRRLHVPDGVQDTLIRTGDLVKEMTTILADAPNAAFYRQNMSRLRSAQNPTGLTREQLTTGVRSVLGDPGIQGQGTWARNLSAAVPYYNASTQGMHALMREFKASPIGTALGFGTISIPILASIFTAMANGEATTNDLINGTSTEDRGKSLRYYFGPDPAHRVELPLSLEHGMFAPALMEAWTHIISEMRDSKPGEPAYERALHAVGSLFDRHVSRQTETATIKSVGRMLNMVDVPMVNAILNAGGMQNLDLNPGNRLLNAMHGGGILEGIVKPQHDQKSGIPNAEPDSSGILGKNDHMIIKGVLQSVMGATGTAVMDSFHEMGHRFDATKDPLYALGQFADDYKSRFQENIPEIGGLWGHNRRLAAQTPLVERIRWETQDLDAVARIKQAEQLSGLTAAKGLPVVVPGEKRMPDDPVIRAMALNAQHANDQIRSTYFPLINNLQREIEGVRRGPLSAEDKQVNINNLTAKVYAIYQQIDKRMDGLYDAYSKAAGRPIPRGTRIDWGRGVEQFTSVN